MSKRGKRRAERGDQAPTFDPDEFFRRRGLHPRAPNDAAKQAAQILSTVQVGYLEASKPRLSELDQDPLWGLSYRALLRIERFAEGALCAFVSSSASGEVVARTAIEAAVGFMFIHGGDRARLFYAYFAHHIGTEKKQNSQWRALLKSVPPPELDEHVQGLARKDAALSAYQAFLDPHFTSIGVDTANPDPWPKVFDQFRAVGRELDYRTIYAGLSSQSHCDAEDLLNEFLIGSIDNPDFDARLSQETQAYSWLGVALAIDYYVDAVVMYLVAYKLQLDVNELRVFTNLGDMLLDQAMKQMPPRPALP